MIRDIVSNEEVKEFFKNELKLNKDSGTYLFYGADMTLLMEFALHFSKGLCCETLEGDFCGQCSVCKRIDRLSYSDLEVVDEPDGISVDTVRELTQKSSSSAYEGRKKIFILKDISKMKKYATNALLKTIEEPNQGCFFILLSTSLNILPTIKSRSILVKIRKRTAQELEVDDFTYSFFRGNNQDIEEFKKLEIDLSKGYSYEEIGRAIKEYEQTQELQFKIEIYKALRDFLNNRNYLKSHDRVKFVNEILKATSSRELCSQIVAYVVEFLGDMSGLEERLIYKDMFRYNVNIRVALMSFFLEI